MQKILVIQLARMGDLLQSSPVIQGVREKYGDALVTLLTSEKTGEVARTIPGVDEVVGFDFGEAYSIVNGEEDGLYPKYDRFSHLLNGFKGRSFDYVYNLNYSPVNANLMNLVQYRKAFCYPLDRSRRELLKSPWLSYMFSILEDRRLNRFNLVDIYLHGAGLSPAEPSLSFQPERGAADLANRFLADQGIKHQDSVMGFQLGAGDRIRCWPLESYVRLADLLTHRLDAWILLFGAPSEKRLGEEFQEHFAGRKVKPGAGSRILNLVGKTTIQQLAAFLKRCHLLITPDTGTMHLATAVGTRVLALFLGSAFCHETGPYGSNHLVLQPKLRCYPCFKHRPSCTDYACKNSISPETVTEVVQGVWKQNPNGFADFNFDSLDPHVSLFQSKMRPHFVEYIPFGRIPFSMGDIVSLGYRAMWLGVLDDNWKCEALELENALNNVHIPALSEDMVSEIKDLETDFGRFARIFGGGSVSLGRGGDRFTEILRDGGKTETRWIRQFLRFFDVAHANIRLSGREYDRKSQRLLAGLTRGTEFMKAFLGKVLESFSH